jgi:hypothetical protein
MSIPERRMQMAGWLHIAMSGSPLSAEHHDLLESEGLIHGGGVTSEGKAALKEFYDLIIDSAGG